jgi:OFA family oxalate/formate antiporter-like MFS transporter
VAGFGFGALLWIMVANPPALLGIQGLIDADDYVGSVNKTFLIYGIAFFVLVSIGSLAMVNPPQGYSPKGWDPSKIAKAAKKEQGVEVGVLGMMSRWQFYTLWAMFMFGALSGLMVIGNVKNFAVSSEGFTDHGFSAADAADYGIIAASICLPILNGTGRIVWGVISDKIGRRYAFGLMFSAQALSMALLFLTAANPIVFFIVAASVGFNFGGNFALFPATTADYFGNKTVGPNYGIMFTSYAAGGIAGPLLAGVVQDNGWSFTWAFLPAAFLCLIAVAIAMVITAPKQR